MGSQTGPRQFELFQGFHQIALAFVGLRLLDVGRGLFVLFPLGLGNLTPP